MGLYVKVATTYQVATDSNLADARANWSESSTHATTAAFADRNTSGNYSVADSGTQAIAFGPVTTAHYVLLKTDRQVTVKFNGDSTGFTLGTAVTTGGSFALSDVSITSISIVNASGAAASIDYELVGV